MFVSHYRDARPLADQLGDDLRRLVSTGAWAEGETLPSVAALASSLSLNPKAPHAPKAAMAIELWAEKRARLENGEIDADEYEDWKALL